MKRKYQFIYNSVMDTKTKYETNASKEEIELGILHNIDDKYWVSNEGTTNDPSYHVWVSGVTHSVCDSAYMELELAVCRCNFLARNNVNF